MKYRLLKFVDGEYYEWGIYSDIKNLTNAAFFLGQSGIGKILIEEIEG